MIFTLIIIYTMSARGVAITAIPGYTSEDVCRSSAAIAAEQKIVDSYSHIQAFCIQGPPK
jgi:hypothetical protein